MTYDLYGGTPPHSNATTSLQAALRIALEVNALQAAVLAFVSLRANGATDEEICSGLGLLQNTERPRRRELVLKGFLRDSGEERKLQSGRWAIVWKATPAAEPGLFPPPPKERMKA